MEDLDSLLQDLEKATSTLKNHPISAGGSWKLNKPNDHTISSQPAYTTAKVAKRYSPQYYVNDEPLYQNEQSFQRVRSPVSNQTASSEHDYAAINGRQSHTESMSKPTSPIYAEVPNGGTPNYLVNGNSSRQQRERSTDSDQVNDLIRNLEYDLRNTSLPYKNKSSLSNGSAMHARSSSQSPTQSPRIQQVSEYNRQLVNITPQKAQMNNNPVIEVPLPAGHGPTSNATRELDDLMASLTDFKMNQVKTPSKSNYVSLGKIQVPHKGTYAPILNSDLDSMIGNLEVDLNRQGINTTTKGTCGACGKIIIGQVVTALGTTWHPEHFTCAKCQRELGDMTFFERDGLAYCEQDYHRLYSPKCNYCNKPIYDRCITALDKTWHPEHFCCAHCGKNFGDEGYHEKAGNAYCREDFFKLFAPKCSGCVKPIEDNYVTALGGQWHQDCFVCRDCKSPFTDDKTYFDFEGRPYCEPHYHDKRGNLCVSCRQPITGRCITAMGHKYHPEHFICSFCLKQLNKGTFKKHTDKPYCHSCFDKLFA